MKRLKSISPSELWGFITDEPLLSHFFLHSRIIEDNQLKAVAAVRVEDGKIQLKLNPLMMQLFSLSEKIGVLVHEYLHVLLQHCTTRMRYTEGVSSLKENIAMDMAINQIIIKTWDLPSFVIFHNKGPFNFPPNLTAEEYYLLLDNQFSDEQLLEWFGKKEVLDDHTGWSEAGPLDTAAVKQIAKVYANSSKVSRKGATLNKGRHLSKYFDKLLLLEVDNINWFVETRHFLCKVINGDRVRTYKRLSRRYGFPIAGYKFTKKLKAAVIIDTSASMTERLLQHIGGHLNLMTSIMHIDVIMCDVSLKKKVIKYRPSSELKFPGKGGTDLRPAFEYVEKEGYRAVICFTDGGLYFPVEQSKIPTLWVCVNDPSFKPLFGRICHIRWR
jgi:predicted metal-dependent peptidase